MALTTAERLLQELGVTEPAEIDLDAVAYYVGARVRYRPLHGCEARIIGAGDRAVITVRANSQPRRKRFSLAHELGHWHHHRGQCLACRAEEARPGTATPPERVADGYAADLLMPNYLFKPLARQQAKLSWKTVGVLAKTFDTSQTATAIRLIQGDYSPALLVCYGPNGRKWFTRASSVPNKWFPKDDLDADSLAFDVLFGGKAGDPIPRKIGADAWFDRYDADRYDVEEQSIRIGGDILSLILVTDSAMLEE